MQRRATILIGAILMAGPVMAQDDFHPKRFHLAVPLVQDGEPVAAIVAGEGAGYAEVATRVQVAVREASGAELPIVAPDEALPQAWTPGRSFIVLGRLGDSAAVDALYRNHYVCADAIYPGEGGHELRTVHDPWGTGASAVFLGGSDLAGVGRAVDRFIELLPEGASIVIPHTIDVAGPAVPGPMTEEMAEQIREQLPTANFRSVGSRASSGCQNYHRSGDPGHAEIARDALYRLQEIVAGMEEVGDSRGVVYLPTLFDLVEECDAWTDEDRERLSRFMLQFARKLHYARADVEPSPVPHGNNWNIRTAWSAARYFQKYCGLDINGTLNENVDTYFANQMTWKSREDCPGYGSITVIDILHYVLKRPDFEAYFGSGLAPKMAEYAMTVTDNLGGLAGFGDISGHHTSAHFPDPMAVLAWYYRDGRYLWIREKMAGAGGGADFLGHCFLIDDLQPEEPTDLLGVHVLPLEDWIYENRDDVLATGVALTDQMLRAGENPPHEQCFDKISFRDGFAEDNQYLLLGGQSHGYHSHPDGNAIISFTDSGKLWLFDNGYFVPDTTEHNTVAVFRDGLFQPVPRLTGLDAMADLPSVGMTRTSVRGYNGMDWRRNIIWAKERYFLVLDELTAREDGDFGVQCIFRVIGEPEIQGDRAIIHDGGKRMALVTDGRPTWETRPVTPPAAGRRGLFQNQNARLAAGEGLSFLSCFYCPDGEEDAPWEIVRAADNAVLIGGPDGVACAGAGSLAAEGLPQVEAALFHLTPTRICLADATSLAWPEPLVTSDGAPVDVEVDLAAGTGAIVCTEAVTVRIPPACAQELTVDGRVPDFTAENGLVPLALEPGEHELRFAATDATLGDAEGLRTTFARLAAEKGERLAERAGEVARVGEELFRHEDTRQVPRTVWVDAETGEEVQELAHLGTASAWTEAQAGCGPSDATDGDLESYSAVSSRAPHTSDLPKDLGVEWDEPRTISQAWFWHYSPPYAPAEDGHDIQVWDGKQWVSVDDTVEVLDDGATWVHTFEPVETTRLRLYVTAFAQSRTAIREMKMFARPAVPEERVEVLPNDVYVMVTGDITGDGAQETVACIGGDVVVLAADGTTLWRQPVGTKRGRSMDVFDLNADGRPEIIVGGQDHRVHCYDADGNELWVTMCPADPFQPEREPETGYIDVLAAGDIDGDGLGEVVFGASNWFAYALDHEGNLLWRALNWAHPPLDITLHDVTGDGRLEALIATRYNTANLFTADGERIDAVSAGYHGIPMSVAAGDLDGNGAVEMVIGSRIGNVHCKEHEGERAWELAMGSQVTDVAVADVDGDGSLEVLACSSNHYVICTDADGAVLWRRNVGGAARQMAVGDIDGDGLPEIAVAVADGPPALLDSDGTLLGRAGALDAEHLALADLTGEGRLVLVTAAPGEIVAVRP